MTTIECEILAFELKIDNLILELNNIELLSKSEYEKLSKLLGQVKSGKNTKIDFHKKDKRNFYLDWVPQLKEVKFNSFAIENGQISYFNDDYDILLNWLLTEPTYVSNLETNEVPYINCQNISYSLYTPRTGSTFSFYPINHSDFNIILNLTKSPIDNYVYLIRENIEIKLTWLTEQKIFKIDTITKDAFIPNITQNFDLNSTKKLIEGVKFMLMKDKIL